jgi:2-dehydro-3-deoxyphosphogluconate aldolase / (4S)-4-hydroxy-2-oxoglutarate aldolase
MWQEWLAVTRPLVPVIVLDRVEDAVPLAQALVAGGVHMLEVTLRTKAGLDSIRQIRAEVPDAIVGVGTVCGAQQMESALNAGAQFVVSPGISAELLACAQNWGGPYLPGVATASEVLQARAAGFVWQKFFPAVPAGGLSMLSALSGPFADVQFCPTGGVGAANFREFLQQPNVFAVGGSWLTPKSAIAAQNWHVITELALACQEKS